jgi:hypothetical protein
MKTDLKKSAVFSLIAVLVSIGVLFVSGEVLLTFLGYRPWTYFEFDADEPTVYEPDAVLGWKNRQGTYHVPSHGPDGKEFKVTFLASGARATEEHKNMGDERPKFIIVGGSFTQGWRISDEETFPWKLQQQFPSLNVLNYGTGGYGTYQSLLLLEKVLQASGKVKAVLYGYTQWHEERNVATSDWLDALSRFSKRKHVYVPYATIDRNGALTRNPPQSFPAWLLRESLVTVTMAEKFYMNLKTLRRSSQQTLVTQKTLLELNDACRRHGADFIVALLSCSGDYKDHYLQFLRNNDIKAVDCVRSVTGEMAADDGRHPNGRLNSLYSERIAQALRNWNPTLFDQRTLDETASPAHRRGVRRDYSSKGLQNTTFCHESRLLISKCRLLLPAITHNYLRLHIFSVLERYL